MTPDLVRTRIRRLRGQALITYKAGKASGAIATLLNLLTVGIENPVDKIDIRPVGGLHQQDLVRSHAETPISNLSPLRSRQSQCDGGGINNDKIIASALHFGKGQLHCLGLSNGHCPLVWR